MGRCEVTCYSPRQTRAVQGSEGEGEVFTRYDVDSAPGDRAPPKKWAALALLVALLAGARAARADTEIGTESFIKPSPTVQNRIYTLDGKWEIGVLGAFSLNNILTQHEGGALAVERNFGEYIGLELLVGGGYGGLTDLAASLRETTGAFNHTNTTDLANAGALNAYAQLGLRVTPFYGKLNLAGELPVHFDFFLNAGAGIAYITYNSILGCNVDTANAMPAACPNNDFHQESLPAFAFSAGGGMRLFITQLWTIRVEIHDMIFPDRYYTNMDLLHTQSSNVFQPSNLYSKPGLTQVPLIFVGLGFLL